MPTTLPWDLVNPVAATMFVRELPDPWATQPETVRFLNVLPDTQVPSNKVRVGQITRKHYAAKYRAWDAESPIGTRNLAFNESEVELPPISQKLPLRESEFLELLFIQRQGTVPAIDSQLIDEAYDDFATQTEQIRNRVALAKSQLLMQGKFILNGENSLYATTDYSLAGGQKPTASPLWTNSSATPIDDETQWILNMLQLGYKRPTDAFTTLAIMLALQKNAQYKLAAYPGVAVPGNIGTLTPSQVNAVRTQYGFPPITVVQHAITDYTGTDVPLLTAGKFVLVADGLGYTPYGVTRDAFDLIKTGALVRGTAGGLVAGTYYEEDPVTSWTKVSGAAMPVLEDPRQITIATVG